MGLNLTPIVEYVDTSYVLSDRQIQYLLSFVPVGLEREAMRFCLSYEKSTLHLVALHSYFQRFAINEWQARQQRWQVMRLNYVLARVCYSWCGEGANLPSLHHKLSCCKEQCWPENLPQKLPELCQTIMQEIRLTSLIQPTALAFSDDCLWTPFRPAWTKALDIEGPRYIWRARMLGLSSERFLQHWNPCYLWLLTRVMDQLLESWHLLIALVKR